MIVIFQHPSSSNDPVLRDVLIKGTLECMSVCAMYIVACVHFIYDRCHNRKCWKKNEVKELIIQKCSLSLLSSLSIMSDRCISIDDTLLVDHSLHEIVSCRGWALMKQGDERSFSVYKNILECTNPLFGGHNEYWTLEMKSYPIEVVKHMKEDKEVLAFFYAMHQQNFSLNWFFVKSNIPTSSLGVHKIWIQGSTVIFKNTQRLLLMVSSSTTSVNWSCLRTNLHTNSKVNYSMVLGSLDNWITA